MAKLVFINKNFEEQEYEFVVEKTTVGRGTHNFLVICDKSVSSTHCEILVNGGEVIVRDLDSSNGTFVDGARLNKQAQAKNGAIVKFGLVEARLELPLPSEEQEASISAVHDLRQYQAEERRKLKQKQLHPAIEGKIEPSATVGPIDSGGRTVLMPRPPGRKPRPAGAQDEQRATTGSKTGMVLLLAGVLVAVLAITAWLWWFKH
jgi:pSer/pThr/pTyr-binding forkhead associated (FHA) protein